MSYARVKNIEVIPNIPRDFHFEHESGAAFAVDLLQEHSVVGLDWMIFNRDTGSSITISIDNGTPVTVPPSGSRGYNNVKYSTLKIVAAVNYTLLLAGISVL